MKLTLKCTSHEFSPDDIEWATKDIHRVSDETAIPSLTSPKRVVLCFFKYSVHHAPHPSDSLPIGASVHTAP